MSTHISYDTQASSEASWYDNVLDRLKLPAPWPAEKEQALMEPYTYLATHPGKEVRAQLINAFNQWLHVPPATLEVICRVVQMLHTASLLMDDVEDSSELRRGVPVAHKIYGVPQTINTANYVYFVVFDEIFRLGLRDPQADPASARLRAADLAHVVAEEMVHLHRGQGMDLFWRDSLACPTEAEYVQMVTNKTGGLFRIAVKLMLAHSPYYVTSPPAPSSSAADGAGAAGNDPLRSPVFSPKRMNQSHQGAPDLIPLADLIGLLFQIRDDYMNLQSSEYEDNKGFAEDLTEGKFSFPIIHSIRCSSQLQHSTPTTSSDPIIRPPATLTPHLESTTGSGTTAEGILPNRHLLSVLRQRPTDEAMKRYAVSYMRHTTKSFDYTRDVLRSLDRQARDETTRIQSVFNSLPTPPASASDLPPSSEQESGASHLLKIFEVLRKGWIDVSDDPLEA